jgi:Lon protease-like protein
MSSGDPEREGPPLLEEGAFRAALGRLPLFPLEDVVLFPHALLPLHIFEPRYRKMTRDAIEGNRLVVMGLQLEKERPGFVPRVAPLAGVGEIILANELPDGRFNLVVRGRARLHIEGELVTDEPYRLVRATLVPDDPIARPQDVADADESLRALVNGLADALPAGGELLKQVVAGHETPSALADVLAATLVGETAERQRLLETTDVLRRLERMTREVAALLARVAPAGRAN